MQDFSYTPSLICRAKKYFIQKYKRDLSDDETILFLDTLTDLYEIYQKLAGAAPAASAAGPSAPQVPVTSVECCRMQHD